MVSPQKIKYNSTDKSIHEAINPMDIILDVSFDSDNGAMSSYLNRSAVAAESHDGRYKNTIRYKYDELFSPKFTIVKKDFSDFTQDEVRQVLKYLTSTDRPALLEVYYDGNSNAADWVCIGGFTNIETYKIANSRTVGIVAQFEAITPYAMSHIYGRDENDIPVTYSVASTRTIPIEIHTDDNKPVYPRITITEKGTAVKFVNRHPDLNGDTRADEFVALSGNDPGEVIVVDCANKIITSSKTKRIFGDNFNWKWLELYDGENDIIITGNCTVSIEYREVRKVGEY